MTIKVAVNGFGRIGRDVVRGIMQRKDTAFELALINITSGFEQHAHLFKYDTVYGRYPGTVELKDDKLVIDGHEIQLVNDREPENIPWGDMGIDIVIDSTGAFNSREGAEKYLGTGVKKVIFTAPAKGEDVTIVMGVNDHVYDPEKHTVISNASCTTNCLAPITKVILENFGIERGLMTTVHAYTNDQNIHDNAHKKDWRRARAGAENIIPTSTGAAKAVGLVLPEVQGKLTGYALRVPVPTGSVVDVTFELTKEATVEDINRVMKEAAEGPLKGILAYVDEPIVSSDIVADPHSSLFDAELTLVKDRMVKLVSWYDNEWGYSQRVIDLADMVAKSL